MWWVRIDGHDERNAVSVRLFGRGVQYAYRFVALLPVRDRLEVTVGYQPGGFSVGFHVGSLLDIWGTNSMYIFYRIFQENGRGFAHICRFYNEIVKKRTIETWNRRGY